MKDPLRYAIDEGMVDLFTWRDENGIAATLRWTTRCEEFVPTVTTVGNTDILNIHHMPYVVNSDFYKKYGTPCDTKEIAQIKAEERIKEVTECSKLFLDFV